MIHPPAFRTIDAFAAGQAAQGAGVPMSENPFPPGTLDHTQWIIGYQWGSDAPRAKPARSGLYAWVQAGIRFVRARFCAPDRDR